jgi:hypothetical protein
MTRMWLVDVLRLGGRLEEAAEQAAVALDGITAAFGERSAMAGNIHGSVSKLREAMGDQAGAIHHQRQAYAIMREALGPSHPMVNRTAYNFALVAFEEPGLAGEAEQLLREALSAAELRVGVDSQIAGRYRARLAHHLSRNGSGSEAVSLLLERPLLAEIRSLWEPQLRSVLSADCEGGQISAELIGPCSRLRALLPASPEPQTDLSDSR